jgi:hypothetical protein
MEIVTAEKFEGINYLFQIELRLCSLSVARLSNSVLDADPRTHFLLKRRGEAS